MDSLQQIIYSFDNSDVSEFGFFIQRHKIRKNRKDLELFNLLREERTYKAKELVELLGTKNMNAYHSIRKRLFAHISDFIIIKSLNEDVTSASSVNGLYNIAKYLFDSDLSEIAWKFIIKAEELSKEHELHDLLNSIYGLQIENVHLNDEVELDELITKYDENQVLLKEDEHFIIAKSLVKKELERYRVEGEQVNFEEIVNNVLGRFDLKTKVLNRPKSLFNLLEIMRSSVIATKDFYLFEPFVISQYNRLFGDNRFPGAVQFKARILYMIAHALYRNKKFTKSLEYLNELEKQLLTCSKSFKNTMTPKIKLMYSVNLIYSGSLASSIDLLEELMSGRLKLNNQDSLNAIVNLGIFYFLNNDLKSAHRMLLKINHSDNWCRKVMGAEWVLKKNMMEVLLYIEMEYVDLVESRIRSIERNFGTIIENEEYRKAFNFIKLVKKVTFNPGAEKTDKFRTQMTGAFDLVPVGQADIQAMAFYAWLKSKVVNKPFYVTLIELVKS